MDRNIEKIPTETMKPSAPQASAGPMCETAAAPPRRVGVTIAWTIAAIVVAAAAIALALLLA